MPKKTDKASYVPRPSGTTSLIFENNPYRTEAVDPLSSDSSLDDFIDDEDEDEDEENRDARQDVDSDDDQNADDDSGDEHSSGRQNRSKRLRIQSDDESESSKSSQEMIGRRSSKKKKVKRAISSDSDSVPEDLVGNRSGGRVVPLDDKESDQPSTSAADQPKKPRHSARVNVMKQRHQRSPIKSALEDLEALRKTKEQRAHPVLTPPKAAADSTNHGQEGDNCDENMSSMSEIVLSDSDSYRSPPQDEAEDHLNPPLAPVAKFSSSPVALEATVVDRGAPLTEENIFESHEGEMLPDFRLILGPLPSKVRSPLSPRRRPPTTIPLDDTYLEELVNARGLVEECFLVSSKVCEVSYLRRVFRFLVDNDRRITVRFSPMDQLSLMLPGFPHLQGQFVELSGTISVDNELDVLNVRYLAHNQPESRRWEKLRDKGVGMWPQGVAPKMVGGAAEALDESDGTAVCFDAFVTNDPVVQSGAPRLYVHLSDYVCGDSSPAIRVEFHKLPRYIENFCSGAHLFVHGTVDTARRSLSCVYYSRKMCSCRGRCCCSSENMMISRC